MYFWLFCGLTCVVCFTLWVLHKTLGYGFYDLHCSGYPRWCYQLHVSDQIKSVQIILHIIMCISIALLGGIPIASILGLFTLSSHPIYLQIIVGIILITICYCILYFVFSLKQFDKQESHLLFVLVLIVSTVFFTFLCQSYYKNIETITDTVVEKTVKRDLLYFCNIPVQNVSGELQINSGLLSSDASGNVDTVHEVTYWYVDEHGGGTFGTSPTDYSRIEFLEDGETPYVEIFYYYKFTKIVDNTFNNESVTDETRWNGYVYHLPRTTLDTPLN